MTMKNSKVVVIDVVGLKPAHLNEKKRTPHLNNLLSKGRCWPLKPVFPAVTLPAQASFITGLFPEEHGVVSNGFYFPEKFQVSFWEQANFLVQGEPLWEKLKRISPDLKTAVLFWQNSLYASCDVVITPKPLHFDEKLIQWCYSKPVNLYEKISEEIGEFNLFSYWGPMASIEGSRWIAQASIEVLKREDPDLLMVYLPHLDYCSQKCPPDDPVVLEELQKVDAEVGRIIEGVRQLGLEDDTTFIILSEYVLSPVSGDVPINRQLKENGLLNIRTIQGREYLDFELSPAFAMVDHQVAHIYCKPEHVAKTRSVLEKIDGIEFLLEQEGKRKFHIDHPRSGEFIAVSQKDRWFSYPWWDENSSAPLFADKVDIHNKPGYDPLELFLDPETRRICDDPMLIRGSHGYPPLSENDYATLIISGAGSDHDLPQDTIDSVSVPHIIENLFKKCH